MAHCAWRTCPNRSTPFTGALAHVAGSPARMADKIEPLSATGDSHDRPGPYIAARDRLEERGSVTTPAEIANHVEFVDRAHLAAELVRPVSDEERVADNLPADDQHDGSAAPRLPA